MARGRRRNQNNQQENLQNKEDESFEDNFDIISNKLDALSEKTDKTF